MMQSAKLLAASTALGCGAVIYGLLLYSSFQTPMGKDNDANKAASFYCRQDARCAAATGRYEEGASRHLNLYIKVRPVSGLDREEQEEMRKAVAEGANAKGLFGWREWWLGEVVRVVTIEAQQPAKAVTSKTNKKNKG